MKSIKIFSILWSLPNTILGVILFFCLGGWPVGFCHGVLWWKARWGFWKWWSKKYAGITFGHTILVASHIKLPVGIVVAHELIHVKQYEQWGACYLPAYLLASINAVCKGYSFYYGNVFEIEAYDKQKNKLKELINE